MDLELAEEAKAKAVKEAKAKATEDAKANTEGGLSQLKASQSCLKNLRLRLRMSNHLKHLCQLNKFPIYIYFDCLSIKRHCFRGRTFIQKTKTTSSEYSLTPPSDDNKGKVKATKEEPMKQIMPLIEQGGLDLKMLNLHQFNIFRKKMTLEEAQA
ncbi:hypothetical protein Tco_1103947 [Tanacetum coccineum]